MLRVFLSEPLHGDRAGRWVRYGTDGRALGRGVDPPSRWPDDNVTEVVLAADRVRLIALALPPMPRERLRGAARYALEDQIAGRIEDSAIALGDAPGGRHIAAVASDALIRALAASVPRAARIVPESALAPHGDGWTWCASAAGDGFVRRADGSAFAVATARSSDDALPSELAAALAQSARSGNPPAAVHVAFAADASQHAKWSQASGVPFVAAPAWQWEQAPTAAGGAAPDFLRPGAATDTNAKRSSMLDAFRPALLLGAAALGVYVLGLLLQWSWLGVENWRISRAIVDEANVAQLPDAATPATAFAAIARQNALLRHRALQAAPADALPLLARAAPTLGTLAPGALRAAHYAGDTWTLELARLDSATLSRLSRALAGAGIDALAAPTSGGTRMRLSLSPTAR